MLFKSMKATMVSPEAALKGRTEPIATAPTHFVSGRPLKGPFPEGMERAMFGMGCFWGVERLFWGLGEGIFMTAAGYAGGFTPNPTYEEVCTGRTGHNEVVQVVYDPNNIGYAALLQTFWESHDPTQGMRQGNDLGTQYRSGIYWYTTAQKEAAEASRATYAAALRDQGLGDITTEILPAPEFYYAEDYHQQYLAKVPHGYCGLAGTGVACPLGTNVALPEDQRDSAQA